MNPKIRLTQLLVVLLFAGILSMQAADSPKNQVGNNLGFLRDFDNTFAFTDLAKRSRPWGSVARPFEAITNVDSFGWPKQDAGLFLHVSLQQNPQGDTVNGPAPLPPGVYKIIFKGRAGSILPSTGSISNQKFSSATNTTRADWTISQPAFENVSIGFVDTRREVGSAKNTGLTELQIYLPGFPDDGSVVFTPDFIRFSKKFSILRFMNWMDTNLNPIRNFSERTLPTDSTQARKIPIADRPDLDFLETTSGVSFEYMVLLCNEAKSDMWITIPARCTDDFILKMLKLIRDGNPKLGFKGLDKDRKLYVEFGNEIWNTSLGFLSFERVKKLSDAALADPEHPINFDGNTDEFVAFFRFIAFRAKNISDICRQVFGDDQMFTRVRPMLESQFGDGQATFSTGLRFLSEFFGVKRTGNPIPISIPEIVFGGGGAPYSLGSVESATRYFNTIPQAEYAPSAKTDAILAHGYGIQYVAYEGGPIIADPVTGLASLDDVSARKINADSRMKNALVKAHNLWSQAGGDILVYFETTGESAFEFAPSVSTLGSPKLKAIDELSSQFRAATTTGILVPSTTSASANPDLINEGNFISTADKTVFLRANTFIGKGQLFLPIRTADNLAKEVTISVETRGSEPDGGQIDLFLDGKKIGTRLKLDGSDDFAFRLNGTGSIEPGLNVIRIVAVKGEVQLKRIRVAQ